MCGRPELIFGMKRHTHLSASRRSKSSPAAGYSGTPLPKKLGIKPDSVVLLIGAPDGFAATLGRLESGVKIVRSTRKAVELILLFVRSESEYVSKLPEALKRVGEGGGIWIAWPKKASGMATDLTENTIRDICLTTGFVDYKVCAIDATWSGLKFARRRK